ncbi:histidine phosphatase family protein [Bacillus daqingensis]|uniref:Histidine phosphatase family protein n=1 Tax=Bacillus daqingensis TaxID=872396 RepID=A0ABV9NSE2_9BACI
MPTIYLIRHGQSEANAGGIIQGQSDYPLSSLGKKEGKAAAAWMEQVHLDAIYASDLERASQTAAYLAETRSLRVKESALFREAALGPLEGRTKHEIIAAYPELKKKRLAASGIPGTESFEQLTDRCRKIVRLLCSHEDEAVAAAVSHGGFISILLMYLSAGDSWPEVHNPYMISNTGITKLELWKNGTAFFHFVNSTVHTIPANRRS